MLSHKRPIALILTFLAALAAWAEATPPDIFILHSYNREYRWTEDIHEGIEEAFSQIKHPYRLYTEYLDWKRFPEPEHLEHIADHLKKKYRNVRASVVITSDDKALDFATQYRDTLFSGAAIVFTGVYKESLPALIRGQGNITGVYEEQDIRGTIDLAFTLQKDLRRAWIVSDMDSSGQAVEARIKAALRDYHPQASAESLSGLTLREILEKIRTFSKADAIFIGSYSIDTSGLNLTGEHLIGMVAKAAGCPVYVLNTHHLGTGALGGSLLSPYLLGREAGNSAVKILNGERAENIPPLERSSYLPSFDFFTINRFQLDTALLPSQTSYLNRNDSFFYKYRGELVAIAATFCALLVFLDILLLSFRRERLLTRSLYLQNDKISRLNESLLSSKKELEGSEERYRLATVGSNDAIWLWGTGTEGLEYSDRWYELTGYDKGSYNHRDFRELVHPEDLAEYDTQLDDHLSKQTAHFRCEARIRTASGDWKWVLIRGKGVWDDGGNLTRFAGSITDIDDRKTKEREIESLAYFDQLTGLPNRTSAVETARRLLDSAEAQTVTAALVLIDIDNFKYVNDTFGHRTGDKILIRFSRFLKSFSAPNLTVYRFGGDEFALFAYGTALDQIEDVTGKVLKLLGGRFEIDGKFHYLTVSAGIALYPIHADSFDTLLQNADAALHQSKQSGKTRCTVFNNTIKDKLKRRMDLDSGLRSAIENGEIYVNYQPQIDLKTGMIIGMEALARWKSPGRGHVSPAEFIPIAEDCGQIHKIGFFMLQSASRMIKRSIRHGKPYFTVSVNVSVKQLVNPSFVSEAIELVKLEGIEASRISLEITESFLIESLDLMVEKLKELRAAGFRISLDDFGKGYSSLSYLKALPVDTIKIDKIFIDDIFSENTSEALVLSIISISHQLGYKVVAEGVETANQMRFLKEHECDVIQGYYFGKPVDDDAILSQLDTAFL